MKPGYWQDNYWTEDYWQEDFWPEYGVFIFNSRYWPEIYWPQMYWDRRYWPGRQTTYTATLALSANGTLQNLSIWNAYVSLFLPASGIIQNRGGRIRELEIVLEAIGTMLEEGTMELFPTLDLHANGGIQNIRGMSLNPTLNLPARGTIQNQSIWEGFGLLTLLSNAYIQNSGGFTIEKEIVLEAIGTMLEEGTRGLFPTLDLHANGNFQLFNFAEMFPMLNLPTAVLIFFWPSGTLRLKWTYPSEHLDPWYNSFRSLAEAIDDKCFGLERGFRRLISDPDTFGWGETQKGFRWFNITEKKFKGWNGMAKVEL